RDGRKNAARHEFLGGTTARPLLRLQTGRRQEEWSQLAGLQARCDIPSSISAARPAPERRSVEGLADGDEGTGAEGTETSHVICASARQQVRLHMPPCGGESSCRSRCP